MPSRHLAPLALDFAALRWARRGICLVFAALAFAVALAGSAMADELRLAVSKGPVSLPIYVAESQGYFAREGVAVRVHECSSGRVCFQLLASRQADVATAAELLVTLASFSGSDVAIIATLSSSAQGIKLVARRSANIQGAQDLRGKRIATVAGSSAQYFLDRWLVFHDIDPKDAEIVALAPDRLAGALARHEVDAVAIWEPIVAAAGAALAQDALLLPIPRVYVQHFSLIASRQAIAQREDDLLKLLRALARAERLIAEQPALALKILRARLNGDASLANLTEHDFRLTLEQSLIATMDGQARWAARQGFAPAGPNSGSLPGNLLRSIDPTLLRKAVPGAVSLVQ